MVKYKAILFAVDGDWVTDCKGNTKEEVIEQLANKGSRWFFYPFEGIIRDYGITTSNQRVVDMAPPLEYLAGKSIRTLKRIIMAIPENTIASLLEV